MSETTICPPNTEFDSSNYPSNNLLQDPYEHYEGTTNKFSAVVPEDVFLKFKAIMPYRGAIQATVNTILYGLLKEFESNGINNYDPTYKAKIVEIIKSRAFGEQK